MADHNRAGGTKFAPAQCLMQSGAHYGRKKEAAMPRPSLDDPDLPLADLMAAWPETIPVFVRHRMHCIGCPISPFHTIVDVCAEYHVSEDEFLAELRDAISGKSDRA